VERATRFEGQIEGDNGRNAPRSQLSRSVFSFADAGLQTS
jgi:hypothetical protein